MCRLPKTCCSGDIERPVALSREPAKVAESRAWSRSVMKAFRSAVIQNPFKCAGHGLSRAVCPVFISVKARLDTATCFSLKDITISYQARVEPGDYIAAGYTGPSPGGARGSRTVENIKVSEQARVRVGNNYGGKGVFDD